MKGPKSFGYFVLGINYHSGVVFLLFIHVRFGKLIGSVAHLYFYCSLCVQTCSEVHPASYPMGTGSSFPGAKVQPGRDADHSPPSSAKANND
jgi:hypothetical protein